MAEIEGYNLPDELYYHKEHMWVRKEGDVIRVGLNDFSQKLSGELSFIELPETSSEAQADEVIGSYETGKWMGKIYAPVAGEIVETNSELEDDPSLVNSDPYGAGWIFTMKPADPAEVDALMHGEAAATWLKTEIAKHAK
ncbi:MAG: glycine cleavage system protein GcvH [Candidatus Stahlbacteria bacterium]|nr:MAG: glycine cleavage system protein GcvH [Candidatus Stahlbacteria bacterium]